MNNSTTPFQLLTRGLALTLLLKILLIHSNLTFSSYAALPEETPIQQLTQDQANLKKALLESIVRSPILLRANEKKAIVLLMDEMDDLIRAIHLEQDIGEMTIKAKSPTLDFQSLKRTEELKNTLCQSWAEDPEGSKTAVYDGLCGKNDAVIDILDYYEKEANPNTSPDSATTQISDHATETADKGDFRTWVKEQSAFLKIEPSVLLGMVDPREIIFPITQRKVTYLALYTSVLLLAGVAEYYLGAGSYITEGIQYNSWGLLIALIALDPMMAVAGFTLGELPPQHKAPKAFESHRQSFNSYDAALIVPCHNSAGEISSTLRAALAHFKPQHIILVDNGNTDRPTDNLKEVAHSVHPNISYLWLPVGSKNVAQYAGVRYAQSQFLSVKYAMLIDDDVVLPENFNMDLARFQDPKVRAMTYPITATNSEGAKGNLLVRWQDLEYKIAGLGKLAEDRTSTVLFPHGAISVWDVDTLEIILREHDTIFYADDAKMGLQLQRMGLKMGLGKTIVSTAVPETLIGETKCLYSQRVKYWELGRHIYFWTFAQNLITFPSGFSASEISALKLFQFYVVLCNLADWLKIPVYAITADSEQFWITSAGLTAANVAIAGAYNYIKLPLSKRKDLQVSLPTVLTFPIYKTLTQIFSTIGALRTLSVYWPNYKKTLTIPELEIEKPKKCIWLKFTEYPGAKPNSSPQD